MSVFPRVNDPADETCPAPPPQSITPQRFPRLQHERRVEWSTVLHLVFQSNTDVFSDTSASFEALPRLRLCNIIFSCFLLVEVLLSFSPTFKLPTQTSFCLFAGFESLVRGFSTFPVTRQSGCCGFNLARESETAENRIWVLLGSVTIFVLHLQEKTNIW